MLPLLRASSVKGRSCPVVSRVNLSFTVKIVIKLTEKKVSRGAFTVKEQGFTGGFGANALKLHCKKK